MKNKDHLDFFRHLHNQKGHYPWSGLVELTYRCNFNCIHCYCKGSEDKQRELGIKEWKRNLDIIQKQGCIWLTISGGEPLIRDDFLEIYSYAKVKGFIITLFTNGCLFTEKIIDYLVKFPPYSIELTLNSVNRNNYESITRTNGSYPKVIQNIRMLKKKGLPLIIKTNCLKQNKHEITQIKQWTEELLGKPSHGRYRFKYDPMIYPRLNGDKEPCNHRLSFEELLELRQQDPDILAEYKNGMHVDFTNSERDKNFLYRCNAWMSHFFINPYGRLKFCEFSEKFSVDLRTVSFKEGFYHVFPQVLRECFKTEAKCQSCDLRPICYYCPARAYLETGDEEAQVEYYCRLARERVRESQGHRIFQ